MRSPSAPMRKRMEETAPCACSWNALMWVVTSGMASEPPPLPCHSLRPSTPTTTAATIPPDSANMDARNAAPVRRDRRAAGRDHLLLHLHPALLAELNEVFLGHVVCGGVAAGDGGDALKFLVLRDLPEVEEKADVSLRPVDLAPFRVRGAAPPPRPEGTNRLSLRATASSALSTCPPTGPRALPPAVYQSLSCAVGLSIDSLSRNCPPPYCIAPGFLLVSTSTSSPTCSGEVIRCSVQVATNGNRRWALR